MLSVGGRFVRGGKHYFSGVKRDASPKFDRKTPKSQFKKTSAARRKTVKRQTAFKSDDWYAKAVLSFAISAKS
jgi:fatty acid-binding protein DegV